VWSIKAWQNTFEVMHVRWIRHFLRVDVGRSRFHRDGICTRTAQRMYHRSNRMEKWSREGSREQYHTMAWQEFWIHLRSHTSLILCILSPKTCFPLFQSRGVDVFAFCFHSYYTLTLTVTFAQMVHQQHDSNDAFSPFRMQSNWFRPFVISATCMLCICSYLRSSRAFCRDCS